MARATLIWGALLVGTATVVRHDDVQHSANRLGTIGIAILVNDSDQDLSLRSSSAWAKNAGNLLGNAMDSTALPMMLIYGTNGQLV